ncbi:FIG4 protein [Sporothrix schenckii 1099-18]|uniref:FIG4 protein n=1 Tax=Sporothrix schenckii 1099-18 TaxID=1397361 RepID=A0A0F2MGC0_SPOSC|nr:FIG4 protein [Sporothrix schenckii 1099-18]KJR87900.1 FIG4 protein [Sporothrix schenckii 1099-18]
MAVLNSTVDNPADATSLASSYSTGTLPGGHAAGTGTTTHHSSNNVPSNQPFPQLRDNASADVDSDGDPERSAETGASIAKTLKMTKATDAGAGAGDDNDDDEDPAVARPFLRTASPDNGGGRGGDNDDDDYEEEGDEGASDGEDNDGDGDEAFTDDDEDAEETLGEEETAPQSRASPTEAEAGADGDAARRAGASSRAGGDRARRRAGHAARAAKAARTARAAATHERMGHKMHKFTLYETASRYYIVGEDVTGRRFRVLKIDRTTAADDTELGVTDDKIFYSQKEMVQLLDTIDDGNRGTGGIKLRCTTWGLLGFIRFTGPYYMMLITKKSTVAVIGGHIVYQVAGTELIPLTPGRGANTNTSVGSGGGSGGAGGSTAAGGGGGSSGGNDGGHSTGSPGATHADEVRFLNILNHVNLTQSFYFSYSYDITNTLQHNITQERAALAAGRRWSCDEAHNTMFVWNSHLLQPAVDALASPFDWCRPITHGYIDQASISIYGRTAYVAIIARRSRYFAGARFLKRGANDLGYVANDVETEQIVSEASTTSFHSPGRRLFANPQYTSYVQHRGSIPLYWTQENTGVTPKPPIELNLVDPFYSAAALHFDNLFARYGGPIYVLDLVKSRESTPRESKLLVEFTRAIQYLNQFLPQDKHIIHHAWDMSRANKSHDVNVIRVLEEIAETVVATTGFFRNGEGDGTNMPPPSPSAGTEDGALNFPQRARVQNGVARTNCIDCLDRTNAAQFVIGKCALGHQLHALGILDEPTVNWETDAVNLFTHMYHDHGDTIAVQYGGSQLVNTMETYRKINQWTSHSRDMLETFKRYYNNSFLDGQRQEAYNLFLGNYIYTPGQPMLWDLPTDYHLHHADPRRRPAGAGRGRGGRDYIHWFTPEHLKLRTLPPLPTLRPPAANTHAYNVAMALAARKVSSQPQVKRKRSGQPRFRRNMTSRTTNSSLLSAGPNTASFATDDYWLEFYRPYFLSSFAKMFSFKIKSTMKYIPIRSSRDGQYDLSPFKVRSEIGSQYGGGGKDGDADSVSSRKTNGRWRGNGHRKEVSFVTPQDVARARVSTGNTADDAASIASGASGGTTSGLRNWLSPSSGNDRPSDASIASSIPSVQQQQQYLQQQQKGVHGLLKEGTVAGSGGTGGSMAAATTVTTAATILSSPSRAGAASLHRDSTGNGNANGQGFPYGRGHVRNSSSIATTLDTTMVANGGLLFEPDPRQKAKQSAVDKARQAQLTFAKMVQDSLNPSVQETEDYERYISHPQNLQIVVSTDETVIAGAAPAAGLPGGLSPSAGISAASNEEYQEYVNGSWKTDGLGMSFSEPGQVPRSNSANFLPAAVASSIPSIPGLDQDRPDDELAVYGELIRVPENPLTVTEGDAQKKRYKAYRKWLRGKSLFKQQMVDA